MVVRAFLVMGAAYLRRIRGLPRIIYRVPKNLPPLLIKAPSQKYSHFRGPRLLKYLRGFGGRDSLATIVRRSLTASSTYKRPGGLIRAYNALAGSVHLRHQIGVPHRPDFAPINELSKSRENSCIRGFLSSLNRFSTLPNFSNQILVLAPKQLIGTGCNSAVWAAILESCEYGDGANNELAVKVLYNYYSASQVDSSLNFGARYNDDDDTVCTLDQSVNWVLLHRQLERECGLRPPLGHPNIVPLVGHFVARAPTSHGMAESLPGLHGVCPNNEVRWPQHGYNFRLSGDWERADEFTEGFGGRPLTYYLLMPRFQATLDELLSGAWHPPVPKDERKETKDIEVGSENLASSVSKTVPAEPDENLVPSSTSPTPLVLSSSIQAGTSPLFNLEPDEAVAILAQLFDAVAELERLGVSHRDIKGNNILIRLRTSSQGGHCKLSSCNAASLAWLDDEEAALLNTRFHVGITDFGCAVRTRVWNPDDTWSSFFRFLDHLFGPDITLSRMDVLTHSGNSLLLAPEIASRLCSSNTETFLELSGADYTKADLWAVATLAYPLFGMANPFIDGTLSSATYDESDLPSLPHQVPGVISWLTSQCLKRSASARPAADLVADVLHSWCLLRHSHRRNQLKSLRNHLSPVAHLISATGSTRSPSIFDQRILGELQRDPSDGISESLMNRLVPLLSVCWAADWLTGAARPPDGLRISFYRRITPCRWTKCLLIVYHAEAERGNCMAEHIVGTIGTSSSTLEFSVSAR